MSSAKKAAQIFLSHAAVDKELVSAFETLLAKCLGLTSADIFCSSLEGQGVPKGDNFVDVIRSRVTEARAVVALITPAYLDSTFCVAELGAAWALQTKRLPIVVPPNDFKVMDATLLGIVGVSIDNGDGLAQAFEDLSESVNADRPSTGVINRALREFQRSWEDLKDKIAAPKRIEAAVHAKLIDELHQAIEARNEAEEELVRLEKLNAALRDAKDPIDVAVIDRQFDNSTWEEQLESGLDRIKKLHRELGGKDITRLLILDHFGKPSLPDLNSQRDEISRAVELEVYDPDAHKWNYTTEVRQLFDEVNLIIDIFREHPEAAEAQRKLGKRTDPQKITFWEERL